MGKNRVTSFMDNALNELQIHEISFLYSLYFYFKILLSEEMVGYHLFMSATVCIVLSQVYSP